MKFNFNWKTILATVLMVVGVAVALTADVGIVTIGAIVSIVSAIVLLLSVIFGVAVDKIKKD